MGQNRAQRDRTLDPAADKRKKIYRLFVIFLFILQKYMHIMIA